MGLSKFKTFFVYARAHCPRRSLEASRLCDYFVTNRLLPISDPKKADLIVIFTCGLFKNSEEASILTIEKSLGDTSGQIIITGCLPKIDPERLKVYDKELIISPHDLSKLDNIIGAMVPYSEIPAATIPRGFHDLYRGNFFVKLSHVMNFDSKGSNPNLLDISTKYVTDRLMHGSVNTLFSPRTWIIEIAEGCLSNCSYCAIRLAAEEFHSFPEEQILGSFKLGLTRGFEDFVLLAGDIGCYGADKKTNLPSLLKKLFAFEGNYRILLWDLNIRWFVKFYNEFVPVLKANSSRVSKIVLPIQSGSDRILKLMNRGYAIEEVKECLSDLKKIIPGLKLETHFIVGFPGETEEDFQKTLELVSEIKFNSIVIFRYEDRPNTVASTYPDKISKKTLERRIRSLTKKDCVTVVN
jgi:tRNA A37 methylthiotransferase MiaB